jgi:molybdopterin/thiamine biosynthesis adenylyltransferase
MAHVFQVGAGSGGIVVLDLLARDPRVTRITLVEPDVYAPHNVHRHAFPASAVGGLKAELAAEWVRERRPDLAFEPVIADLTDPARHAEFARLAAECDVGVCAVDNEPAKYAFDALMRAAGKPWTLGEVLSGGIGGWVHRFAPGGPCYGCVASYLQRTVTEAPPAPPPDYANPGGPVPETTVPAPKASIEVIAALHAVVTLDVLVNPDRQGGGSKDHPVADAPGSPEPFTSLLFTLKRVPGVFEEAFRPFRFRVPKSPGCLICSATAGPSVGGNLDVAVDEALGRLGPQ